MGVHFEDELAEEGKIHGTHPKAREEVLIGNEVAVRLFKSAGDTLPLSGRSIKIAGVLDETGSQDDFLIFSDLSLVQEVLKKPEALSLIEVSAFCLTCPIDDIVGQISKVLPHAKVTAIKQTIQTRVEALEHFKKFSVGISIIVLLIGGLIVFTNMMASVNERKREIGIFRALLEIISYGSSSEAPDYRE
jgi:putative ABC transport system permease protein